MKLLNYSLTNNNNRKAINLLDYQNNKFRVITGRALYENYWINCLRTLTKVENAPSVRTLKCSEVTIEARIKPFKAQAGWMIFKDQDDPGNLFYMQTAMVVKTMDLLLEKKLENREGWIDAKWSFKGASSYCTIEPARVQNMITNPIVDTGDALDVSEFLV